MDPDGPRWILQSLIARLWLWLRLQVLGSESRLVLGAGRVVVVGKTKVVLGQLEKSDSARVKAVVRSQDAEKDQSVGERRLVFQRAVNWEFE